MEVDEDVVEATPEDKGEVSSEAKVDEDVVEVSSEDKEAAKQLAMTKVRVKIQEINIEMEEAVKEENFLKVTPKNI